MRLPLELVFKRGAIFLWLRYAKLDDPTYSGQTKAKFIVVLSASRQDDPILFILTTSEKSKHVHHPATQDLVHLSGGTYSCFPVDTLLDAGEAGLLDVGRDEFVALYEAEELVYKGVLEQAHLDELFAKIGASRRVAGRVKAILTGT